MLPDNVFIPRVQTSSGGIVTTVYRADIDGPKARKVEIYIPHYYSKEDAAKRVAEALEKEESMGELRA